MTKEFLQHLLFRVCVMILVYKVLVLAPCFLLLHLSPLGACRSWQRDSEHLADRSVPLKAIGKVFGFAECFGVSNN